MSDEELLRKVDGDLRAPSVLSLSATSAGCPLVEAAQVKPDDCKWRSEIAIHLSAVPEPATYGTMGIGAVAVLMVWRSRRKRAA